MLIWAALFIPLILSIIALLIFKKKIVFYELLPAFVIGALCIFCFKSCEEAVQVSDTEYLIDYVVKVEYYEQWDEWIHKTCSYQSCSGTGKNRHCRTKYYDCSYRDFHPAHWEATLSNGKTISISQQMYRRLVNQYKNESFVELNRHYYTIDGNKYESYFKGVFNTIEYIVSPETYENRVQASQSIFNFQEIDTSKVRKYSLYDYPDILSENKIHSILGYKGAGYDTLNLKLNRLNSLIGKTKQVKLWYLIFENKPMYAATMQEAYWKGGNKNEVVICIGTDKNKNIKWCYIFSWTKKSIVKIHITDEIMKTKTLDDKSFSNLIQFSINKINHNFKRREFAEFDYLTVEPPTWCIITTFIVVLLVTVGCLYWAAFNDHGYDDVFRKKGNQNYFNKNRW